MRIFGYVLFGLGSLFLILFAFADFGGAHLNWTPFFVSFFLVYVGWRMARGGSVSKPE